MFFFCLQKPLLQSARRCATGYVLRILEVLKKCRAICRNKFFWNFENFRVEVLRKFLMNFHVKHYIFYFCINESRLTTPPPSPRRPPQALVASCSLCDTKQKTQYNNNCRKKGTENNGKKCEAFKNTNSYLWNRSQVYIAIKRYGIRNEIKLPRTWQNLDYIPSGSTCLAICRASEVAKSVFAGVTAKIRQVSLVINWNNISLIWASMSAGWSPTGTFVNPGRSINVIFNTKRTKLINSSFLWIQR